MRLKRIAALTVALAIFICGCSGSRSERNLTYTDTLFDTAISVTVLDSVKQDVMEGCKELCRSYDAKFDISNEDSEISKINNAKGKPVEVSDDTITLIKKGLYYSEISDGVFDITIGAVTKLWDFTSDDHKIPSNNKIKKALTHVNWRYVSLSDNTVTLTDKKASLDVGAIAKGYIADRIKDYLKDNGVSHAIINLGGDVLTMGSKLDGSDYNIGIQQPFGEAGDAITSVKVSNKAVATSGLYERYFEKDGEIYHHIISSTKGKPVSNSLASVTVITNSCLTADAVSTWCFLLGYKKALKLVDQLDNVDAVFITKKDKIRYSTNFMRNN